MIEVWKYAVELNGKFCPTNHWRLHSCFENGINLIDDHEDLLFIGSDKNGELPFALHVTYLEWVKIKQQVTNKSLLFFKDGIFYDQTNSAFQLSIKKSLTYQTTLTSDGIAYSLQQTKQLVEFAKNCSLKNGFGSTLPVSLTSFLAENQSLGAAFQQLQSDSIKEVELGLRYIIGRGVGLTPSGDDFLVGLVAINQVFPFFKPTVIAKLTELVQRESLTTDIGKAYLMAAVNHRFSTTIVSLVQALSQNEPQKINKLLQELIKNGHTSGLDTATGLLVGVCLYNEVEKGKKSIWGNEL